MPSPPTKQSPLTLMHVNTIINMQYSLQIIRGFWGFRVSGFSCMYMYVSVFG